jgi:hypothetical protein
LLILEKDSVTSKAIDVYQEPLVDELVQF